LVRVDLRHELVTGYLHVGGSPQDVKLSPDGRTFYAANRYWPKRHASGVDLVDAATFRLVGSIKTRPDAHGLYVSRDTRDLYITDRAGEAITVIDFATRRIVAVWHVPGTPDMGNLSPDGTVLWVSSRYTSAVLAISTRTGHVIATVRAGVSPHGVCVWPQPGRYHTTTGYAPIAKGCAAMRASPGRQSFDSDDPRCTPILGIHALRRSYGPAASGVGKPEHQGA
jgi:YVTN family beta-propeller protein